MPRIEPTPTPLSQPFWDATRDRRLLAQRCAMCDRYVWYPREHCPGCLRSELEWVELSGNGTIYTFNVMRKPGNPMMADAVPYVLALVDLDEGVRMTTNIVHVSPEEVIAENPADAAYLDGQGSNEMRLNFSQNSPEVISEGIRRLGEVIRELTDLFEGLGGV